jgi:hypothetical protein
MHPADPDPYRNQNWEGELAEVDGLDEAEVRVYEWERTYTTPEYVGLLATASDVRLLDEARRDSLCAAAAEVLDGHGGTVGMRMRTRVCLARRQEPSASTQSHARPHRLR